MGMDISGINPKTTGTEPVFPSNWDELSEKAQSFYWELKSDYERDNPGIYFRANIWSWRPIHLAIVQSNISLKLGIDDDTIDGMEPLKLLDPRVSIVLTCPPIPLCCVQ